ncbi:hypothetical protein AHAS_Ahas14G0119500 [Arachis hypogaea]
MSQEKKYIVEEIGFGALTHVPKMNVSQSLLRELAAHYDEYYRYLDTLYGKISITPEKVVAALGINHSGNRFPEKVKYIKLNEADKEIIDGFKCATLASLTKYILDMSVEGGGELEKILENFCCLCPEVLLAAEDGKHGLPIHKPHVFHVDNIRQWDWATHLLSFLRKGIEARRKGKKQSVDGCVFVLMLIYFHESKFPHLDAPEALGPPWVAH